jgi:hypothetical protein
MMAFEASHFWPVVIFHVSTNIPVYRLGRQLEEDMGKHTEDKGIIARGNVEDSAHGIFSVASL